MEARIDGAGRVGFTPADTDGPSAKSSWHVTHQAKLKINTIFMELCREAVPAGYDSTGSGVMPGKAQRCQMGQDETLEYRAVLDLGA